MRPRNLGPRLVAGIIHALPAAIIAGSAIPAGADDPPGLQRVALYPRDARRDLTGADVETYPGGGILYCHGADGIPRKAAAAWLVGGPSLVVLNAHNFRNRRLETIRMVADCFFQIGGRNYLFRPESLRLGTAPGATALHITDDWALLQLAEPAQNVRPQPVPQGAAFATGPGTLPIVMVSPAGHENYRGQGSIEACAIQQIDAPGEDDIRRARHDCNDGFGGSGSGLFDPEARLVAMQSASLSMNSRRPFDVEFHYGSALLFEGALLAAIREELGAGSPR
jgi:hypothetical protein